MKSPFNSDLHSLHEQSPDRFNAAFNSLRQVNTELTRNPMVAGGYMRRVMMYDDAGASGVLVEALNQKERMGVSPMADALAKGNQMGVQHVFQDRVNRNTDQRAIDNAGVIEAERLKAKYEGPYANQDQQDRMALETHKIQLGHRLNEEARLRVRAENQADAAARAEAAAAAAAGSRPAGSPSFLGSPLVSPFGKGRNAGRPVFSPGGGFVGVPSRGDFPMPSIQLQVPPDFHVGKPGKPRRGKKNNGAPFEP